MAAEEKSPTAINSNILACDNADGFFHHINLLVLGIKIPPVE